MAAVGEGDGRSPTCPHCGRSFASYQGRRVHERSQHPQAFHAQEVEALMAGSRKARWDEEELVLMAAFEASHPGERMMNIQIRAQCLPHRTLEAIKAARRPDSYKERVRQEALRLQEASSSPVTSSPTPPSQGQTSPQGSPLTSPVRTGAPDGGTRSPLSTPLRSVPDEVAAILLQESNSLGLTVPSSIREVEAQVNLWCPPRAYAYRPPGLVNPRLSQKKKAKSKRQYRRIQKLWKKDRGRAIQECIVGIPDGPTALPPGTGAYWENLFQRESLPESRCPPAIRPVIREAAGPITHEEVLCAIRSTKKGTAPGPDGRGLEALRQMSTSQLCWAYNAVLILKDVPDSWARGRTTLIPKKSDAADPGDFRPITVTSLLLRLFNKIIAGRLMAAAPLPNKQKGFAPEEGVVANLLLVQKLLLDAQRKFSNLHVAFIDFKKAFDSVSHPSLVAAAKRWGIPAELTEYISTLYSKACTDIVGNTCPIRRGVLQGDPLSPYLFNITLDWALSQVPEDVGARLAGLPINYIAYADDVVLTASTHVGLQAALDVFVAEAGKVGLELGHAKCATISILGDGKRKRWLQDSNTYFTAGGTRLRALRPGETYKYLGLEVGLSAGQAEPRRALAALIRDLASLQRAPLKPQQKIWGLKHTLVPKHQYARVLGRSTNGTLKRYDREVRTFVRKALHLPKDTPNAGLYTKVSDGGLGIPEFSVIVPALKRGALERLSRSADERVAGIAGALLLSDPVRTPAKEQRRLACLRNKESLYASADGRGLKGFDSHPNTHDWVENATALMKGATYVSAVKTRLGVVGTRLRASRGRPGAPVLCDLGCGRPESLGHILQVCPVLAPERTRRHNRVLDLLHQQLSRRGYRLLKEPNIRTPAGVRKPDLVVWDDRQSVVIDVQITADNATGDLLGRAHGLKVSHYNTEAIRTWVREKTGHPPVFTTLTINWRGLMATPSYNSLRALQCTKADLRLLVVRSLEGSVDTIRNQRDIGGSGRA